MCGKSPHKSPRGIAGDSNGHTKPSCYSDIVTVDELLPLLGAVRIPM